MNQKSKSQPPQQIAAFYHFAPVPEARLNEYSETLEKKGKSLGLKGLLIFAVEGINGTICGSTRESVEAFLTFTSELLGFPPIEKKWSEAPEAVFRKFKVRQRVEIVSLGKPDVQPLNPHSPTHLSPEEWDRAMAEEGVIVLDTRNWYETRIGKFEGALDPNIEEFNEFSDYLDRSGIEKEKKVLIYCTGGIRCEKAIVEMNNKGFKNVYQLDGGILNYLAEKPERKFEGECFVFDHRVAVDQKLQPSQKYKMCPHCGQPADQEIECRRCDSKAIICVSCTKEEAMQTCSKNCAHHYAMNPGKKGRSQEQGFRYSAISKKRLNTLKNPKAQG